MNSEEKYSQKISRRQGDTPISENSMQNHIGEQLTLFPVDSHASRSVLPGSKKAKKMTVGSGKKCYELSQRLNLPGLLAKTLLESSKWHSTKCFLTWKPLATPQKRILFQLVPSMPRIGETGSGLSRTPKETDGSGGAVGETKIKERIKKKLPIHLRDQIKHHKILLPTPKNRDYKGGSNKRKMEGNDHGNLDQAIHNLLPTPKKQNTNAPGIHGQGGMDLQTTISMLPTPTVCGNNNRKGASKTSGNGLATIMNGTKNGLKLQPNFVEYLMGYPLGWSEI